MKSLWMLSAILLFIGFFAFLASSAPVTIKEAYTTSESQKHNYLITDGVQTAAPFFYSTYYSATANFTQGDAISIVASSVDGITPLKAEIERYYGLEVYKSEENKTTIAMDYTIPSTGKFSISVSRFDTREYGFNLFTSETSANVKITAEMTKIVPVQKFRDVTTYPYKGYESIGFALIFCGIGAGVLSVAQNIERKKNNLDLPPPPMS